MHTVRRGPGSIPVRRLLWVLCAGLAAAGFFFLPLLPLFCVSAADRSGGMLLPDRPSLAAALERAVTRQIPGTDFVVSYTHSVNKGRVKDFYTLHPDRTLYVTKTRFVSYGAGIPEPEAGNDFIVTDDYIEIRNLNRLIPRLVMRVGVIADHAIECGGNEYRLADWFEPQTAIEIKYRNVSVFDYIRSNK